MAHKALIDGTAYEVTGGRCLVDGTAYSIQKGRTLVDGTGYDVSFAPAVIPVEITGSGNSTYCYVTINGTTYTAAASGIEVLPGDDIVFAVRGSANSNGSITIDGDKVASSSGATATTFTWVVPENCTSIGIALKYNSFGNRYGTITVTTT